MSSPSGSDPRTPLIIGIIAVGALLLGGIVWAVLSAPSSSGTLPGTAADPNLSFQDENDPTLGSSDASVTVRVFGDLQCPACKDAEPGFDHVRQSYGDRVKIVWDDFPLPASIHPLSQVAANAARCGEEQGKFWEMHDALYAHQSEWSVLSDPESMFITLAEGIGLDTDGFKTCYETRRYQSKIDADVAEGSANNVSATPTFFVNKTRYIGVLTPAQWDAVLQPLLSGKPTAAR